MLGKSQACFELQGEIVLQEETIQRMLLSFVGQPIVLLIYVLIVLLRHISSPIFIIKV